MSTENQNTEAAPVEQLVAAPAPAAPVAAPVPVNPLLARIQLPGETFKLPSCGVFYKNGELHPSVTDAEVHVHPMTVIDEITIKTPDMLFSGRAVEEVFGRCIPQVLKPTELLAKDVDFLMLCLRKVSYGNTLELASTHFDCEKVDEPKSQNYMIDINVFIQNTKRIDPTSVAKDYTVSFDNDQVIKMQPVRFSDFINLMQVQEDVNMAPEKQVDILVKALARVILSVDEITDPGMIGEWLRMIKPAYLNKLNDQLEASVNWGPDFKYKIECKDCGEAQEVVAPLNPLAFFT